MKNKKLAAGLLALLVILGVVGICFAVLNKPEEKEEPEKKEKKKDPDPGKEPDVFEGGDFNIQFIKTVNSTQTGNYLVSPYSVEIALSMLRDGSKGESEKQITDVIGKRAINDVSIPDRIGVANALFIREQYKNYIESSYVEQMKKDFSADVLYDPFVSPKVINDWVSEKTKGMINEILQEMSKDFVLGMADAIAIDVEWSNQFECNNTREEKFTKTDGSTMKTEMMHKFYEYNTSYFETDNAKGVIIPYVSYDDKGEEIYGKDGRQLEFVGILPNGNVGDYVKSLSAYELKTIDEKKRDAGNKLHINLSLPRFSYEFDLKQFMDVLKAMGITDVFDKEKANLTGIMTLENIHKIDATNLYVATAIHKTYIDLNEKGTKAAAVTYFGIDKANSAYEPEKPEIIEINFDKPFAYMIRDVKTKEVLFFGVVQEPNVWKGSTCSNK